MKPAAILTLLILNIPVLAAEGGVGVLLYDPNIAVLAPADLDDARNVALVLDAPASVKAYCKPGTLGKLSNQNGEADPVSIEGRFTKKAAQRLTVLPICEHKLAGPYRNRVFGVAVSDVTAFNQLYQKPDLVFYIFGKTGESHDEPGQVPVRLNDFDGDGLSELGLRFDAGETMITHQIQVYKLFPSPKYIVTIEQGFTTEVGGPENFNAAVYSVPTVPAAYIGAEFGSTFRARTLYTTHQNMNIIVR